MHRLCASNAIYSTKTAEVSVGGSSEGDSRLFGGIAGGHAGGRGRHGQLVYWLVEEIEQAGLQPLLVHPRKARQMMGVCWPTATSRSASSMMSSTKQPAERAANVFVVINNRDLGSCNAVHRLSRIS